MDLYDARLYLSKGKSIYDLDLRVTFYARVSTDKDEQAHSLTNQVSYYRNMIQKNSNWTFVEGYVDEGISGTSVKKRNAFLKMINDAKLGRFDFIITKEISRFSRNTLDSINYTQELLKYNVGVLFESDNINTFFPDAELRLTIMSSIAQDEVRKISERVKFGFKRAIEKGVVLGNNKIWGYTKDNGRLIIDEKESAIVQEIFDMYANQKKGIRTICKILNERGVVSSSGTPIIYSTTSNIIKNPKYKGYYCGNKTRKYDYKLSNRKTLPQDEWVMYKDEDTVPPIVSEELWDKANRILAKRSANIKTSSYTNKYPYSGKLVCGEHNDTFYRSCYKYKNGTKEVWQCKRYNEFGKAGCISPTIYTTELDKIMQDVFNSLFMDKNVIIKQLLDVYKETLKNNEPEKMLKEKKKEINAIMAKKDKLLDLSIDGRITNDEFAVRNDKFNIQITELKQEIELFKQESLQATETASSIEILRDAISHELNFDDGFDENLIDALLDKIIVNKTEDKNVIRLQVFLKVLNEQREFFLCRKRGKETSVCTEQYI